MPGTEAPRTALASRRLLVAAILGLLALAYLCSMSLKFLGKIAPQDEGILLVYPDLILRGLVPYRDFAAIYPPGNFYSIAAALHLLGNAVLTERLVGIAYGAGILLGLYLIGARRGPLTGALAAACALVMLHKFPYPGAYSIFGAFALMVFALFSAQVSSGAPARRALALAASSGLLAGLLVWFRQDIWVIGTAAAAVALHPARARLLAAFAAGSAIPALAFGLYASWVGSGLVFENLVLDPMRMGPARKLALQWDPWLTGLVVCIMVNLLLALRTLGKSRQGVDSGLVRAAAVVSIGLLPSVLQRADAWHVLYVLTLVAPLTVIGVASTTDLAALLPRIGAALRKLAWVGLVALALVLITRGAERLPGIIGLVAAAERDALFVDEADAPSLRALRQSLAVQASPGQSLFIGPADMRFAHYNDAYLYYYFPALRPASRYIEMNPGSANRAGSGLAEQVAAADWLILTDRYDRWGESIPGATAGPDAANRVVQVQFCRLEDHPPWILYRRCTKP